MISGGQILWYAVAICENDQDLLADGISQNERRFGESFKGPIIPFGALVGYLPNSERERDWARIHQFGKQVLPRIFLGVLWSRGEFGRKIFWLLIMGNWEGWMHQKISRKTERERSPDNPKRWRIGFSCGRWSAKIIRKKLRIPRIQSETRIRRKERESRRRISWR